MDLSTIANVATALTVLTGVAFGLIEMRRARREREERAAFAAVQALMTPEWMSSSMIVASILLLAEFEKLVGTGARVFLERPRSYPGRTTPTQYGAHE